jgi:hypothetical protein
MGPPKTNTMWQQFSPPHNVLSPFSFFDKGDLLRTNVEIAMEKPHSQGPNNCKNVRTTSNFIGVVWKL